MSSLFGFTLLAAVFGALGGWVTGAALYKNFFNKLLRICTFSATWGMAAGLYGSICTGATGLLGLLIALPLAYIAWFWVRIIEPKMRPWDVNPKPSEDSGDNSDESSIQVLFLVLGAICGGGLGLLSALFSGFWVALFVSTIVAALAAMIFFGGVILTIIMLFDTLGFLLPIIWAYSCAFVSMLVNFFFSLRAVLFHFLGWLTSIGNRIGDKVSDEDKRIGRDNN